MAALGLIFLAVVLTERLIEPREPISSILAGMGWVIWAAFVAEYGLRLTLARSRSAFLRRYWWQILLLAIPFLNFVRVLAVWRVTRVGRALSAGLRVSRTAGSKLTGRVAWVASLSLVVALVSADLLYEFAGVRPYSSALYTAALATINGTPVEGTSAVVRLLNLILAVYSVAIFASLAGATGAFLLEMSARDRSR